MSMSEELSVVVYCDGGDGSDQPGREERKRSYSGRMRRERSGRGRRSGAGQCDGKAGRL